MKGGKRAGAGRPKGSKSKSTQERLTALLSGGDSPLEYMLAVMRDGTADRDRRDRMAQASAPFIHPRLAATEVKGDQNNPIQHKLTIEFIRGQ